MLMATMLARMPDLCLRVKAQHTPDHAGRCRDCQDDIRWPCELYRIATEAERYSLPSPRSSLPWSAPATSSFI